MKEKLDAMEANHSWTVMPLPRVKRLSPLKGVDQSTPGS